MDFIPNRYDALILKISALSPLAKHILEREQYRLRLETDDVESESVLQEMIFALRDDLADLGLYFKGPLADLYENFSTLDSVLDTLAYVFPTSLYLKLRDVKEIRPQIENILNGGIGDESTLILYMRWLGSGPGCYDHVVSTGAEWISQHLTATALFDVYLHRLIDVGVNLSQPIALNADEILDYTAHVREIATRLNDGLVKLRDHIDDDALFDKMQRRCDLYIRHLLQPVNTTALCWLFMTDCETLSADMLVIYLQRWDEFRKGQRLYGSYYYTQPLLPITPSIVIGVAIRLYSESPSLSRHDYTTALLNEFVEPTHIEIQDNFKITRRSLIVKISAILYPIIVIQE